MPIKEYVTPSNTLLIIVDGTRFYEFRDLTPRDLLWIDYQNEADSLEFKNFNQSLLFLMQLIKRLLIYTNSNIEQESWSDFIEINLKIQSLVLANRITWKGFLSLVFASGNKSFASLDSFLDLSLTIIHDIYDTVIEYYETQERIMDKARGVTRH